MIQSRDSIGQNWTVPERWTRERRRQHTRDVLLDAAEEVFARRGFEGASLEEIAEAAGFTRGAIYKNFGGKEDLFLAVNHRFNERMLQGFLDALDPSQPLDAQDLGAMAKRWYGMQTHDPSFYALSAEFNLFLLRNPEARARAAEQRRAVAEMIARFMDQQQNLLGLKSRIPSLVLARIVLAAGDGLELATQLDPDGADLYEPFLEMIVSVLEPAEKEASPAPRRTRDRRKPDGS